MGSADATRPLGTPTPEQLLHRLEWQVVRRLDGILQGNYRTVFRGAGMDFLDLREYEPGDDVRHIDWNVTARMDTPFVRQYAEDRELTAWLLLDRSPSMGFGPIDRPKELVLCELATTFARLLTRGGNRVGAILFDNELEETLPPRSSRNQVLALTRSLLRPPPATNGAVTDLTRLLETADTDDPSAVARRSRLRLHHRAGVGAAPAATERAARGRRHPARRPSRVRASRRRAHRGRGRGDR